MIGKKGFYKTVSSVVYASCLIGLSIAISGCGGGRSPIVGCNLSYEEYGFYQMRTIMECDTAEDLTIANSSRTSLESIDQLVILQSAPIEFVDLSAFTRLSRLEVYGHAVRVVDASQNSALDSLIEIRTSSIQELHLPPTRIESLSVSEAGQLEIFSDFGVYIRNLEVHSGIPPNTLEKLLVGSGLFTLTLVDFSTFNIDFSTLRSLYRLTLVNPQVSNIEFFSATSVGPDVVALVGGETTQMTLSDMVGVDRVRLENTPLEVLALASLGPSSVQVESHLSNMLSLSGRITELVVETSPTLQMDVSQLKELSRYEVDGVSQID